ncbi:MAG: methyl-accepting chemotaxis protein [Acetobacteraceae bacterium]
MTEAGEVPARSRRSGFGVRRRLWGTMGVLALLPIASGYVGWRALDAFGHSLGDVVDVKLPQIEGALLLARDGDRLVLSASGLAGAMTQEARRTQFGLVTAELSGAEDRLRGLRAVGLSEAATQTTETALRRLRENTAAIDHLVGDALDESAKLAKLQQVALALGDRFSRALEPISAEQRNAMSGFIATLGGDADTDRRQQATDGLQSVADATRALGRMGAANATLQSTIARIPLALDGGALEQSMQTIRRDTTTLSAALDDLDDKTSATLQPLIDEWDRFTKDNPTSPRRRQLDLAAQLVSLAGTNKELSQGLSTSIEASVEHAKEDATRATTEARKLTDASRDKLLSVAAAALFLAALLSWLYVGRGVIRRLTQVERAMRQLAGGDLDTALPASSADEIGSMVGALAVFKDSAISQRRMEAEQAAARKQAAAEKVAALQGMAETVEAKTAAALQQIGGRTAAMAATAEQMSASASRTGESARSAEAASASARASAQTVAVAAEELSASIREIGHQVARSTEVVGEAVTAGGETKATIEALNEEVARIGAVADMIGEIAAKTNLLALNATIEAARAGEAGRGFAVVASEVKSLATQTARSTQEIAQHIGRVSAATGASVAAVARIEAKIAEINAIASSIGAAIEQQGAATAEIARNVAETATAAGAMTSRTNEVSAEADQTSDHAAAVRENVAALDLAVGELRHSVIRVVRTSTAEVDRRGAERYEVDMPCRVTEGGRTHDARLANLSDLGAEVRGGPNLTAGVRGVLHVQGVNVALPFTVRQSDGDAIRLRFELDTETARTFAGTAERLGRRLAA